MAACGLCCRSLQISKFAAKPALVALYSKAAARAFEPFGKGAGTKVFYETSLAQVPTRDTGQGLAYAGQAMVMGVTNLPRVIRQGHYC